MTQPKISYGHGYCNDCSLFEGTDFTDTGGSGQTVAATWGYKGDYLDLNCTVSTGAKTYYVTNHTALSLSTTLYPIILFRYETRETAKAKIELVFSDTSTQTVLAEANTFSGWVTEKATLTTAKTLDHIRFYCNGGTGHVYYDFVLVCTGQFTFPQWNRLVLELPNRFSNTKAPSKSTNRSSWMGADNAKVTLSGDIDDQNTDWITDYGTVASILYDVYHRANLEPFQWLNTDRGSFKVNIDNVQIIEDTNAVYKYSYTAQLHEYSLVNKTNEFFQERFGLTGVTT
jgi:hypothetical protein